MYYNFQHTFIPYKWTAANPSDAPLPVLRDLLELVEQGFRGLDDALSSGITCGMYMLTAME